MIQTSNSRIDTFNSCNYKFYRLNVKKDIKSTTNKWAEEGIARHKNIEEYLLYGKKLPKELEWLCSTLDSIKSSGYTFFAERKIAVNRNWEEVEYFSKDVMYRSSSDLILFNNTKAILWDWKTGKVKEDPIQLERQAVVEFKLNPQLELIQASYVWIKEQKFGKVYFFTRDNLDSYVQKLYEEMHKIQTAANQNFWPKMPTRLCQWCPVHISLGGDCNGN